MTVTEGYLDYLGELLAPLGHLRMKRMFGGVGIYCDDHFFAVVMDDQLYLKADAGNRQDYEALGLAPFTYAMKNGRTATMSYYPVPAEVFEDQGTLLAWARKGLAAAARSRR